MNISKLITMGLSGVLLAGLVACSGRSGNILDTIPADASAVITVNAEKLCAECGITFGKDGAEYAEGVRQALPDRVQWTADMASRLDSHGVADMETVAILADNDGNTFVTFSINEFESFKEATDITWTDDEDGMHTGTTPDGMNVVASDAQVWLTDLNSGAADGVRKLLDKSRENNIGSLSGISSQLTADNIVNVAVLRHPDKAPASHAEALQTKWIVGSMNVADGSDIILEASAIRGDGEPLPVKGLQPFNQALLSYIPANPLLVAGAGITPEFDWSGLSSLAMLTGNFQFQAVLSMAMPYLTAIDGSVLLGITPLTEDALNNPDPSNMAVTLMATMPQAKVNELLGMIKSLCFTNGIPVTADPKTGILTIDSFGLRAYAGNVDGCFAVSTRPFEEGQDNSLAPVFTGKEGAAVISMPSLKAISPVNPAWGLHAEMQLEPDRSKLKITLPGAPKPVLKSILTQAAR